LKYFVLKYDVNGFLTLPILAHIRKAQDLG